MSQGPERGSADEPVDGGEVRVPVARKLSVGAIGTGWNDARYQLASSLARGGMGEVYLADRLYPDGRKERVVVKRLLETLREDAAYVQMFQTEAAHLARLDHPNIVRFLDVPVINETRCLAIEYVHGKSVAQMIDQARHHQGVIAPDVAAWITRQVLAGLEHVHGAKTAEGQLLGLVHRDVTPGNILVSYSGQVKLADFGIAKSSLSAVSTTVGIVKGKARYLAPEQIMGDPASPRSDLFSLALALFEMLTGEPLYDRPSVPKTLAAIARGELPDLHRVIPAPPLVDFLYRALAARPSQRFADATEMAASLDALAPGLGPPVDRARVGGLLRRLFGDGSEHETDRPGPAPTPSSAPAQAPPDSRAPGNLDPPRGTEGPRLRAASIAEQDAVPTTTAPTVDATPMPPGTSSPVTPRSQKLPPFPQQPPLSGRANISRDLEPTQRLEDAKPAAPVQDVEGEEATLALGPAAQTRAERGERPPAYQALEAPSRPNPPDPAAWRATIDRLPSGLERTEDDPTMAARRPAKGERSSESTTWSEKTAPPRLGAVRRLPLGATLFVAGAVVGLALHFWQSEAPPPTTATVQPAKVEPPALPIETTEPDPPAPPLEIPTKWEPAMLDVLNPKGARVQIDGQLLDGKTPLTGIELTPGSHEIIVLLRKGKRRVVADFSAGERADFDRLLRRKR